MAPTGSSHARVRAPLHTPRHRPPSYHLLVGPTTTTAGDAPPPGPTWLPRRLEDRGSWTRSFYFSVITDHSGCVGAVRAVQHVIRLEKDEPFRLRPYPMSDQKRQ
ncbi:hypothetical protein Zmor_028324 [Zophobas morio]|uniref:Uncharacterized protein n=1 Tax=Zophobas morio TaxID=2755281 RepID=A0AA38HQ16_9CUCU|nr:hypothetical protein Zmor_028324 [Zophobas morio]